MIPAFPQFKKLELSDRPEIEAITAQYEPYSDFNFVSMWSWDTHGEMQLSMLHGNLVVRFSDYITEEPFYSFLGFSMPNETADELLGLAAKENLMPRLQLLPEETAMLLDTKKYQITDDRRQSDYIISVEKLMPHDGTQRKLSSRRLLLKKFKENNKFEFGPIDISDPATQEKIQSVFVRWEREVDDGPDAVLHLKMALDKFFMLKDFSAIGCFGAYIDGELVGYSINEFGPNGYVIGHFQQGDKKVFSGIYALLMHDAAPYFKEAGYQFVNLEQDLDMPGLRSWKMSHHPVKFLKKFQVSYVENPKS